MDPQLLAPLGTALSAFIAALSYYAKTRHERRRSTRRVLYYLLEIHHLLARSQFSVKTFPVQYVERVRKSLTNGGIHLMDADAAALSDSLQTLIRKLTHAEMADLHESIAKPFAEALAELSRDDPILAFDLRGKDSVADIDRILAALQAPAGRTGIRPHDEEVAATVVAHLQDFSRDLAVTEISRCIRSTAWRCDALTHLRVLHHLHRSSRVRTVDDIHGHISTAIDGLLEKIQASTVAHAQSRTSSQ